MTVRPPSVPSIALHIDEREIEREDGNTPVDEISSSREGLSRDIERGDDIPSDLNTPVDETSSSRDGLSGDIERE